MEYTTLGDTGMTVSKVCLGCMSFGDPDWREWVLGDALAEYDRDEFVVATKGFFRMRDDDPNSGGLSRKAIEQELDASLDRLGMDTVDLYQTHRWDDDTPIATTMRALDDAVEALDLSLSSSDVAYLEEPYEPVPVSGHE
jgi:aryl-alcohol dehydrogenase-like predicted oxidoreductase